MNYFGKVLYYASDEIAAWRRKWSKIATPKEMVCIDEYRKSCENYLKSRLYPVVKTRDSIYHINPIVQEDLLSPDLKQRACNAYQVIFLTKDKKLANFIVVSESGAVTLKVIASIASDLDYENLDVTKKWQDYVSGLRNYSVLALPTYAKDVLPSSSYVANLTPDFFKQYDIKRDLIISMAGEIIEPSSVFSSGSNNGFDNAIVEQANAELIEIIKPILVMGLRSSLKLFIDKVSERLKVHLSGATNIYSFNFCANYDPGRPRRADLLRTYPFLGAFVKVIPPVYYEEEATPQNEGNNLALRLPRRALRMEQFMAQSRNHFLEKKLVSHTCADLCAPKLIQAVDYGQPIIAELAKVFNVSEAIIERVVKLPERYFTIATTTLGGNLKFSYGEKFTADAMGENAFFKLLKTLPEKQIPRYQRDPQGFLRLCNAAILARQIIGKVTVNTISKGGKDYLLRALKDANLIAEHHGVELGNLTNLAKDAIEDMLGYLSVKLLAPTIFRRSGFKLTLSGWNRCIPYTNAAIFSALFENKGILQLLSSSENLHRRFTAIENVVNDFAVSAGWPKLIEDTPVPQRILRGGYKFVALNTNRLLAEEGALMNHCVGGYSKSCYQGRSHIVSMRNYEGKPILTIHLSEIEIYDPKLKANKVGVCIKEQRGIGNRPATTEEKAATDWLVNMINKNVNEIVDFDRIVRERAAYVPDEVKVAIGFDPKDHIRQNMAFGELKAADVLPKKLTSLDAFIRLPAIDEVIESLLQKGLGNVFVVQNGRQRF